MTDLPSALSPWRAALADLPLDVQFAVGPWLARLARGVGPLRRARAAEDGAPDGFAGLSHRGPYDRLLISEWLWAETVPDEFVRRAAAQELSFYALAREEPAGGLRSTVLFDAGPSQIGAPRLIHLAVLIVFAQRAIDAGAELGFGVLQATDRTRWRFTVDTVEKLIRSRSIRRPTDRDWQAWLSVIDADAERDTHDDLWVVGGPDTRRWAESVGAGHLEPSDPVARDARTLKVDLRQGTTSRDIELSLPAPEVCVRLLREPLLKQPARPSPRTTPAAARGLRFNDDGRHLLVRTPVGVTVYRVAPNPGQSALPRHLAIPEPNIMAAGSFRRRYFVISSGEQARLRTFTRRGRPEWSIPLPAHDGLILPGESHRMGPLLPLTKKDSVPTRFVTTDAVDQLFVIDVSDPRAPAVFGPLAEVLDVTRRYDGITALAISDDAADRVQLVRVQTGAELNVTDTIPVLTPATGCFGCNPGMDPMWALRMDVNRWRLSGPGQDVMTDARSAVGAVTHAFPGTGHAAALVTLYDDQQTVVLHGPQQSTVLYELPFAAVEVAMSNRRPLLAARGHRGQVAIVGLDDFDVTVVQP